MKGCSGISNSTPESAYPLTVFSDIEFERSKTRAILSDHDISHSLSRNISGSVPITCQSVEDNFKYTLKKLRVKIKLRIMMKKLLKPSTNSLVML